MRISNLRFEICSPRGITQFLVVDVGAVRDIELGERGVSDRLKWVRIVGSKAEAVIRKEYPIRLAFGGLPSAMFIIDGEYDGDNLVAVTFIGGGLGHGVGLCQHGARGLALGDAHYGAILDHYFTGITIERLE